MEFLVDINPEMRAPEYKLVLHKLNEEPLMTIRNIEDLRVQLNFAGIDELSFRIPLYRIDNKGNKIINERYGAIEGDMLILLNNKEFFYIHSAKEVIDDTDNVYKEIQAYSREFELAQKRIIGYGGASRKLYVFKGSSEENQVDENGIPIGFLNYLEDVTSWEVEYINPNLMDKHRELDFPNTTFLEAVKTVQETFGCFFQYDTIKRKISVYEVDDLQGESGLRITDRNFLKTLEKEIKADEIKTRLYLYGRDNISVQNEHIMGKPYIENFNYYKNEKFMSKELIKALNDYEDLIEEENGRFKNYLKELEDLNPKIRKAIDHLNEKQNDLEKEEMMFDTIMARPYPNNDDRNKALREQRRKVDTEKENVKKASNNLKSIQRDVDRVQKNILDLRKRIQDANKLDEKLTRELDSFVKEDVYMDNNYTEETLDELLEDGQKALMEISQPRIQFEVGVTDFLQLVEHQHSWNKLKLGEKVKLYHKDLNFDYYVRLISIEHSPDSHTLQLKFSSTNSIYDSDLYLIDLISEMKTVSSNVDFSKYKWDKGEDAELKINQYIDHNLDLAKQSLETADGQVTMLDHRGYWGIKLENDGRESPEQLRMTNNLIAMTKDRWDTVDVAISPTLGINAELINGKIGNFATINANQINAGVIRSEDNSTWISLDNGTFNFKDKLKWQNNKLDIEGHLKAGTINIGSKFAVDKYGNMRATNGEFEGEISGATSIRIGNKFEVTSNGIMSARDGRFEGKMTAGSININDNFKVNERGIMTAKGGTFEGTLEAVKIRSGSIELGRSSGSTYFSVTNDGSLYAKNGRFSGSITGSSITGGTINGGVVIGSHIEGGSISGTTITAGTLVGGSLSGVTIKGNHIEGGTITGSSIKGGSIEGLTIKGSSITGTTFSTNTVGNKRMVINGSDLETRNANNRKDGIQISISQTHNELSVYDSGSLKGSLSYSTDQDSHYDYKLLLQSSYATPMKIMSGGHMSITAGSFKDKIIFFEGTEAHFGAVDSIRINAYKLKSGGYSGIMNIGGTKLNVVNGLIIGYA